MNIIVEWDSNYNQRVIRYTFQPGWHWDEVSGAFARAATLLDTVNYKVDIIMDFSLSGFNIPIGAISHAQRAFANPRHPNVGLTVMIGNRFIATLTDTARKLMRQSTQTWDIVFVADQAAAHKAIEQRQIEQRQKESDSQHAS